MSDVFDGRFGELVTAFSQFFGFVNLMLGEYRISWGYFHAEYAEAHIQKMFDLLRGRCERALSEASSAADVHARSGGTEHDLVAFSNILHPGNQVNMLDVLRGTSNKWMNIARAEQSTWINSRDGLCSVIHPRAFETAGISFKDAAAHTVTILDEELGGGNAFLYSRQGQLAQLHSLFTQAVQAVDNTVQVPPLQLTVQDISICQEIGAFFAQFPMLDPQQRIAQRPNAREDIRRGMNYYLANAETKALLAVRDEDRDGLPVPVRNALPEFFPDDPAAFLQHVFTHYKKLSRRSLVGRPAEALVVAEFKTILQCCFGPDPLYKVYPGPRTRGDNLDGILGVFNGSFENIKKKFNLHCDLNEWISFNADFTTPSRRFEIMRTMLECCYDEMFFMASGSDVTQWVRTMNGLPPLATGANPDGIRASCLRPPALDPTDVGAADEIAAYLNGTVGEFNERRRQQETAASAVFFDIVGRVKAELPSLGPRQRSRARRPRPGKRPSSNKRLEKQLEHERTRTRIRELLPSSSDDESSQGSSLADAPTASSPRPSRDNIMAVVDEGDREMRTVSSHRQNGFTSVPETPERNMFITVPETPSPAKPNNSGSDGSSRGGSGGGKTVAVVDGSDDDDEAMVGATPPRPGLLRRTSSGPNVNRLGQGVPESNNNAINEHFEQFQDRMHRESERRGRRRRQPPTFIDITGEDSDDPISSSSDDNSNSSSSEDDQISSSSDDDIEMKNAPRTHRQSQGQKRSRSSRAGKKRCSGSRHSSVLKRSRLLPRDDPDTFTRADALMRRGSAVVPSGKLGRGAGSVPSYRPPRASSSSSSSSSAAAASSSSSGNQYKGSLQPVRKGTRRTLDIPQKDLNNELEARGRRYRTVFGEMVTLVEDILVYTDECHARSDMINWCRDTLTRIDEMREIVQVAYEQFILAVEQRCTMRAMIAPAWNDLLNNRRDAHQNVGVVFKQLQRIVALYFSCAKSSDMTSFPESRAACLEILSPALSCATTSVNKFPKLNRFGHAIGTVRLSGQARTRLVAYKKDEARRRRGLPMKRSARVWFEFDPEPEF